MNDTRFCLEIASKACSQLVLTWLWQKATMRRGHAIFFHDECSPTMLKGFTIFLEYAFLSRTTGRHHVKETFRSTSYFNEPNETKHLLGGTTS